jgi:hypothetical protein
MFALIVITLIVGFLLLRLMLLINIYQGFYYISSISLSNPTINISNISLSSSISNISNISRSTYILSN